MTLADWLVFAGFWVVFVTSPGPNAVNCIRTGMSVGLPRALLSVAGILTQAALFLSLSAAGLSALLLASPLWVRAAQLAGAALLFWTGLRQWRAAARPLATGTERGGTLYVRAFLIATINPKSVAGYLAAFSQFVVADVPIWQQMWVIFPTALAITTLSYTGYTLLGVALGRAALSAVADRRLRRGLAGCFLLYGALMLWTVLRPGGFA